MSPYAPELPFDQAEFDRDATIQARFETFHATNPWVYDEIVKMARELAVRGHRRIGMRMIWEVLRWRHLMGTFDPSSSFRLNDHYPSRYARLVASHHPDLGDRLELRQLRAE